MGATASSSRSSRNGWNGTCPEAACQNCAVGDLDGAGADARRFDAVALAAREGPAERARLVELMLPWLRRWLRRYQGRGVDTDDLMQEAVLGVLRAVEGFDPGRGPFIAWARVWVRQALQQTVAESARAFRLPTHVLWEMHELKEARERLTARLGREPGVVEPADALGCGVDRV